MKNLLLTAILVSSSAALAHHKGFHIECASGATSEKAIQQLHTALHKFEDGNVGEHANVDVDSVSAITLAPADKSAVLACVTVSFLN